MSIGIVKSSEVCSWNPDIVFSLSIGVSERYYLGFELLKNQLRIGLIFWQLVIIF